MTVTRTTSLAGTSPGGAAPQEPRRATGDDVVCATCGVLRPRTAAPQRCPVCDDERQYVPLDGQRWLTPSELARDYHNTRTELEPGLCSIRTAPAFAIGQHALWITTPRGNVLWDCLSVVDDATVAAVRASGGLAAIAISHPHFYGAMRAWSRAFGGVPIWIHEGDRDWIPEPSEEIRLWTGASTPLVGDLTLVHVAGHFASSQVLHWPAGAGGRGALLVGDLPNMCADRRWVTFMRSYPNYIPLAAQDAEAVVAALRPLPYDRLYGWNPERVMLDDAKARVERSLQRHQRALAGEHGVVAAGS